MVVAALMVNSVEPGEPVEAQAQDWELAVAPLPVAEEAPLAFLMMDMAEQEDLVVHQEAPET